MSSSEASFTVYMDGKKVGTIEDVEPFQTGSKTFAMKWNQSDESKDFKFTLAKDNSKSESYDITLINDSESTIKLSYDEKFSLQTD